MRWKIKKKTPPVNGETRVIKRFLLFPRTINYETRWLEIGHILQTRYCYDNIHLVDYNGEWEDTAWWDSKIKDNKHM